MDFDWTEEQQALRNSVVRFAQRELADDVVARDQAAQFPHDAWKQCADFGILGLPVPEEYGGSGADTLSVIVAMEALGYGCRDNGLIFSLNAQMWACQHPILRFGTDAQKHHLLPRLCDGSLIAAHGMSEPGSGSDAFAMATTARRDGDRFVLNGSKTFVTGAPVADVFVVFAVTNPDRKFAGVSAFLVERDNPGFTVGPPLHKMGLRTSPMAELFFDDCVVPAADMLGKPGAGSIVFNAGMERERSLILASVIGSMDRELERSVEHARDRRQFGQPIGKFQAVSHRLVDMKLRLETARLLLYRLGWLLDHGRPAALDSALVKLYLSECFVASSLDAVQVFGGYGYMEEYELERQVRDAIGSRLYSGTSDIQRNLAARFMGL
ncbi:MAG: acyl-CoA dehydrogenase family protein [Acidimicrobiales bacterium]